LDGEHAASMALDPQGFLPYLIVGNRGLLVYHSSATMAFVNQGGAALRSCDKRAHLLGTATATEWIRIQ
jgi:hypothetical protein